MLEGYFFVHNFSDIENITFFILKVIPHVKYWWETFCEKEETKESPLFSVAPTKCSFRDVIKEQYYHFGSHDNLYRDGPHCSRKGTKKCESLKTSSIYCAPS
jgi:hypothetical protein